MKRRDGFEGEKLISIPPRLWQDMKRLNPALFPIYITHIGYFPQAKFHYCERREGCEDNILFYCVKGKGHYVADDKKFEVTANQFVLIPATSHYLRYWADKDDPWSIYWVHFTGESIAAFNESLNLSISKGPISIPVNLKGIEIWQSMYNSFEMGYSMENVCNATFCLYHFIAMFIFPDKHLKTEQTDNDNIINKTIRFMKDNLRKKLSVEDLAANHKLSASHFSSLFKKNTGISPIDYFIHLKMQKACQLLYANELKIKDLAVTLGYDDPYYFSRAFKKYLGLSPEQYKLTAKKGH
jgi:AraC-like DNA-binding protein